MNVENGQIVNRLKDENEIFKAVSSLKDSLFSRNNIDKDTIKKLSKKYEEKAIVLALVCADIITGICIFYANDFENNIAYLSMLVIDNKEQGKGYASILINEMKRICKKKGMRSLRLEVNKGNSKAIRFYTRKGFIKDIETEESYIFITQI
ncbi:Acetyltransferase (GNAT) family protein [Pseudobutyrivibrio ruminis]|uniref:Acetyltransferase (GNAT) family protein n=1 Tax=Pseudobutyrivibrio ruminis TaxID=46206 RepID=A0A1H7K813_9FIRM|nr:GNAT family N-acetyltransferase [Pseudobutyrivibrio ruminis]SEK83041.1 Acetyltransferase (GNAT) family protein [Pseudobutyrivibrio ruminis]